MPAPVIVVHNEDNVRQAAMDALRAAGHECVGFSNPMTALDAIDGGTRARVLVTRVDFGEDTLNGVALARMLKFRRPGVKTVFVARVEYEPHAADAGIFLPLPFNSPGLVAAVERLLTEQG